MTTPRSRSRAVGALAAITAVASLAVAQAAGAAPVRTATTTTYSTATYLQHALDLPASDADPAIEPVTYDRFQWLLQQPGRLAILIGDPARDPSFKARARDTEAAAKAAGVRRVYWFDPNLSGSVRIGGVTEPALDIRDPAGITSLAPESRKRYDDAWRSLVGDYLGNGLKVTHDGLNSESATVTITADATAKNDAGGAEVDGRSGALYDYTGASAPADVQDSFFLVYDEAGTAGASPAKVVAWTNLTDQPGSAAAQEDVATAIARAGGGTKLAAPAEFGFWRTEVNEKQREQAPGETQNANVPVLGDADAADGWRVRQLTYPQLVDLFESGADDANAVVLFGGTWCPNTRAVLPAINRYAQQNDVTVYNFDTVLDGGLVGGATTSARNPLQTRNTQNNGTTTPTAANPSFLYGDLVARYLNNLKTEYDPAGSSFVSYFPGGDTTSPAVKTRKLQVPYLIGYQRRASGDGVTRQWIIDKGDGTYKEYMSNWYWTNPQPGQLNISTTQLPAAAPIWSKINEQLKTVTWQTDPATLVPSSAIDTDDDQYLVAADKATVGYTAADGWRITSSAAGDVTISPAALSSAFADLGASAPATLAAAKTALLEAQAASTPDDARIARLRTVVGAWGVAQSRKTTLTTRWGTASTPSSILGGLAAVHEVDRFFAGLPGPVVGDPGPGTDPGPTPAPPTGTTPIAAPATIPLPGRSPAPVVLRRLRAVKGTVVTAPTSRKGGVYRVVVTAPKGGAAATGKVTVKLKKGAVTKTLTGRLSRGVVTVKVPKLAKGTWKVAITFPGDGRYAKVTRAGGAITVRR